MPDLEEFLARAIFGEPFAVLDGGQRDRVHEHEEAFRELMDAPEQHEGCRPWDDAEEFTQHDLDEEHDEALEDVVAKLRELYARAGNGGRPGLVLAGEAVKAMIAAREHPKPDPPDVAAIVEQAPPEDVPW